MDPTEHLSANCVPRQLVGVFSATLERETAFNRIDFWLDAERVLQWWTKLEPGADLRKHIDDKLHRMRQGHTSQGNPTSIANF